MINNTGGKRGKLAEQSREGRKVEKRELGVRQANV